MFFNIRSAPMHLNFVPQRRFVTFSSSFNNFLFAFLFVSQLIWSSDLVVRYALLHLQPKFQQNMPTARPICFKSSFFNETNFKDLVWRKTDGERGLDDDDATSCSSSDLFELDHLSMIGNNNRYCEELLVYETANVHRNRAIANGLIL
ncbi:hypothetical protein Ddye_016332 [Dipteronia dyeriana]|uniref:Uncharacterized protein n=1 Tax=Dipteronia dyeriana TaxID=168575 RepID=A0AAD9WZZ0_9ROSI|nr:hypothetical protein Ddye_016332 [Dipteronia dyeriana]